jgi:3-phosphoshikimate 1-carboxyvinyltransferase
VDVEILPGSTVGGEAIVPGDKSIAHRWLILAATATGRSRLAGLPPSLDVLSTARCLSALVPKARPSLDIFARRTGAVVEGGGSTWNADSMPTRRSTLEVEAEGRSAIAPSLAPLDCGNSGTSMRLLAGVLSSAPFLSTLTGDGSLSRRPMERVARPLRDMGAAIVTTDGHAPVEIEGASLTGITFVPEVPTAQVKSAVILAGLAARGETIVRELVPTRDHTERALAALGAPIDVEPGEIRLRAFQHDGFDGSVPGDPSSAAFLIAAAALTGSSLEIHEVGLNPSRLHFLEVMRRMGIVTTCTTEHETVGEPVGTIEVAPCSGVLPTRVAAEEIALVIDEIPVLAAIATHARSDSWFIGAGELRVKESDRLEALTRGVRALGGIAAGEGDDLVIGGGGLAGGRIEIDGDHRIAMAMTVSALGADAPVVIAGIEAAEVSFPGFVQALAALGAEIEER